MSVDLDDKFNNTCHIITDLFKSIEKVLKSLSVYNVHILSMLHYR